MPTCATCGADYESAPSPKGGRPPKHCPDCRRQRGAPIDSDATNNRRNELRRVQRAAGAGRVDGAVVDASRASLLAAGLAVAPNPSDAAAAVGLALESGELERLAMQARTLHPDVVSGRIAGTARLVTTAVHVLTQALLDQAHLLAPRDLAGAVRQLAQVREALLASESQGQHTAIELAFVPPEDA